MIIIDKAGSSLGEDPQHREVHLFMFECPVCKRWVALYGTYGPAFTLPDFFTLKGKKYPLNVWHLDIHEDNKTVSISPSIALNEDIELTQHTKACHLVLTNEPFKWAEDNIPPRDS